MIPIKKLEEKSKVIRDLIVEVAYKNQSSHVGSCLSCVEILVYLYYYKMKPEDIFILSKGHAALALYAVLHEKGLITKDELYNYPEKLGGHVPYIPEKGLYAATGSLGHGCNIALGYAIANSDINVYCLVGDGEAQEGSFYESKKITESQSNNLYFIIDHNGLSGFQITHEVDVYRDGHDFDCIKSNTGSDINVLMTIKGKGLGRFEDKLDSHYWSITKEDYEEYKQNK